jgi:hypothetical protein
VPDVTIRVYDYPKTETHAAFNAAFRINFIAGNGGGFKLIGTEGEMEVGQNQVPLKRSKLGARLGGYSLIAYTEDTQQKIKADYAKNRVSSRA